MGKRNTKAKRSLGSLPKGLVRSNGGGGGGGGSSSRKGFGGFEDVNPFEITARQKRPKQLVHNRPVSKPKTTKHALESLQRRQTQLRTNIQSSKKANSYIDKRIGQYDPSMSTDDKMIARLVKERTRQSKKSNKFRLDDDDNDAGGEGLGSTMLTHKGQKLDPSQSEVLYSDDEDDDGGNLEAVDTELHFGGSAMKKLSSNGAGNVNPYGRQTPLDGDLATLYGQQRKTELDDLIARRKAMKAEKMATKETQVETFERMDEEFGTLSRLLRYRKNEVQPAVKPPPTAEDDEMKEWNLSVREMMIKPKRQATDRTKTPEELAKEEAERLHKLETRRLARMNGDFDDDDFSDISVGDKKGRNRRKSDRRSKKQKASHVRNPDELSDSEDENDDADDHLEARFTADGMRYFDKDGNVVEKEEGRDQNDADSDSNGGDDSEEDEDEDEDKPLVKGTRVQGCYRIEEQYNGQGDWYDGVIVNIKKQSDGTYKYDVEYDDGDFEENMIRKNIRVEKQSVKDDNDDDDDSQSLGKKKKKKGSDMDSKELQVKQKLAKEKARSQIPFVFEAPTTLDALEDLIIKYARTGSDASTIIERIHASNSVRLDHRNGQKVQNFYDVLLRRFMELGDNVYLSGRGGDVVDRFSQLDCITKVLYKMAQESPEIAGSVWNRRIGILHNAHEKRLRDSVFEHETDDGDVWTPWPSTGVFLLLRLVGQIFPVTDKRHHVVTPTMLFLAQMVSQTPVSSEVDLTMGVMISALLIEYSKEAKRVVPEALSFLASTIRLFAPEKGKFTNPALSGAYDQDFCVKLRHRLTKYKPSSDEGLPRLKLEKGFILCSDPVYPSAILSTCLGLIEVCASYLKDSFTLPSETEALYEASAAILALHPKSMAVSLQKKIAKTASTIAEACPSSRAPLARRNQPTVTEIGIKTLAPRMEDPTRYSMSRDKGKKSVQAAIDRTRREYKREHKAITRELRMDGTFIEEERRTEQAGRDAKARAKRQKNFAWLESEQASMNQQVRMGGGLLKGGGMGLARAKAASGKLGIKKGGKF